MNKYESVIIVNPNVDESGLKALEEKFTGLIAELERVYRITDDVIKFIVVRKD